MSEEYSNQLNEARKESPGHKMGSAKHIKEMAKSATPWGAVSLMAYIDPFDMPFMGIALTVAILKDVLDLIGVGSVPIIGWVLTIMVTSVIGLCLLIMGASVRQARAYKKSSGLLQRFIRRSSGPAKRYGLLFAGTIFELLPFINIVPVETTVTVMAFMMILKERRESALETRMA